MKIILDDVETIKSEKILLENGLNRVLRENIYSPIDLPPFDRSAMDGFAVKSKYTFKANEGPITLKKSEDTITPGKKYEKKLEEKEAVEITTGALMPKNKDSVIKTEEVEILENKIVINDPVSPGKNVSKKGEDLKKDQKVLNEDKTLKPQDLAILKSIGKEKINTSKKPKIGIIATGNELIKEWSQDTEPGKIVDINSILIQNLAIKKNLTPKKYGIYPDQKEKIKKILKKSIKENDITIITGGSSKSKVDIPPKILNMKVHGINIRPGKAFGYSKLNQKPVFTVSGYPVAAMIQFKSIIEPYTHNLIRNKNYTLKQILNKKQQKKKTYKTKTKINSVLGRRHYIRVKIDKKTNKIEPIKKKGSGIISSLTQSDGYIIIPEDSEGYKEGEEVELIPWY